MYALVEISGKQFKVEEGSRLKVPYISNKVGEKVLIDKILYLDNGKDKIVGMPHINGISFNAKIVEHGKEEKVIVFKFKRRKGYQRKNGHRQLFSLIEVGKLSTKASKAKTKATSTTKKTTKTKAASTTKKTTKTKAAK